eukprot:754387-Prorocentrum_minimum.AAC.2
MSMPTQSAICVKTISGQSTQVLVESGMTVHEVKSRAVLSLGGSTKPSSLDHVSLCFMSRTLDDMSLMETAVGENCRAEDGKFLVLLGFKRLKTKASQSKEYPNAEAVCAFSDERLTFRITDGQTSATGIAGALGTTAQPTASQSASQSVLGPILVEQGACV